MGVIRVNAAVVTSGMYESEGMLLQALCTSQSVCCYTDSVRVRSAVVTWAEYESLRLLLQRRSTNQGQVVT